MLFVQRVSRALQRRVGRILRIDPVTRIRVKRLPTIERLGSSYGGWAVDVGRLHAGAICFCVGCGEDISFDLELARRFACEVYAFDPTPRSIEYVQSQALPDNFTFDAVGVWDENDDLEFFAPANADFVSFSALNLQATEESIVLPVQTLQKLMAKHTVSQIDLLKLDIEGAEYRVVNSLLEDGVEVGMLCVEYDEYFHPLDEAFAVRIQRSVRAILAAGYEMVAFDQANYTFVKKLGAT